MKKWILTIIVAVMLSTGGCDFMEPNSLTKDQITAVTNYTDSLNAKLAVYQKLTNELAATLQAGGVLDANDLSKLAKLNEEVDRITPQIAVLSAAVRDGEYSGDDPGIITILKALKAGNQASAPFNPYAIAIDSILGLVIVILGLFAKKKSALATLATSTLKNVVTGVQVSSDSAYNEVTANIHNDVDQKALVTSLKPELPEGFEIYKIGTVETPTETQKP